MSFSPVLAGYRGAVALVGPLAEPWLKSRARAGKEDAARLPERFGHAPYPRPRGRLIWLHGASVGESGVALQLVEELATRDASLNFLITSGTRTSAELIAKRASARTMHVYAPIDRPDAVARFLAHWRPDLGVFVESEMWPNLILQAQAAGIPLALINARMSPSSLARLERWPQAATRLLNAFSLVLAADTRTTESLAKLHSDVSMVGNLKLAAAPLVDAQAKEVLQAQLGARPVWLGASTHAGEDEILIAAHHSVRAAYPDALLILAPRHPERGETVAALAGAAPRRALGQDLADASIYVADTLGELGVFYTCAKAAFVAGSLLPDLKGHNPAEAAHLDAAILTGPHFESFADLYAALFAAGAAQKAANAAEISDAVLALWRDDALRQKQVTSAREIVRAGDAALQQTVERLQKLLPAHVSEAADATA